MWGWTAEERYAEHNQNRLKFSKNKNEFLGFFIISFILML